MGGLNVKLPSYYENFLEWSIKTSSVLITISELENIYTKM